MMLKNSRRFSTGLRWGILSVVLAIMLYAGLNPRGFAFRNTATLQNHPPGLVFGAHGIAFTRPYISEDDAREVARDGLTLSLEVDVADKAPNGFAAIAVLHNGDDAAQLFLGQYQDRLVLMNGDDYDYKRRLPRTSIDTAKLPPGRLQLLITSDSSGATFFANGKKLDHRPNFIQSVPAHGRLTLGNSPDGKHPWNGTLHRFALFQKSLEPNQLTGAFQLRPQTGGGDTASPAPPWLSYRFDRDNDNEEPAQRVADQSGNAIDLEFPPETAFLTRKFLEPEPDVPYTERLTSSDGLLNFFGFVPLGWLVAGMVGTRRIQPGGFMTIVAATIAGFLLSLGIEFLQTWIPTRSSHLPDLVLNTIGTFVGATLLQLLTGQASPRSSTSAPPS